MSTALKVFLRGGVDGDSLILQSPVPDDYVQFGLAPGGDGTLQVEASSRQWACPKCEMMPLTTDAERVLFDLGFAPCLPGESNYSSDQFPLEANLLAAVAQAVFLRAFDSPQAFGLCALFSQPETAEDFYLVWSVAADA